MLSGRKVRGNRDMWQGSAVCRWGRRERMGTFPPLLTASDKTITIHHECPCRIEISHPRGRKFNQERGLLSPWLNSDPEGEISLSYMDRLMMDCFSPTFRSFFSEHEKLCTKRKFLTFYSLVFHYF